MKLEKSGRRLCWKREIRHRFTGKISALFVIVYLEASSCKICSAVYILTLPLPLSTNSSNIIPCYIYIIWRSLFGFAIALCNASASCKLLAARFVLHSTSLPYLYPNLLIHLI